MAWTSVPHTVGRLVALLPEPAVLIASALTWLAALGVASPLG